MSNDFNILEFSGLSEERPWELQKPTPTDLRGVLLSEALPTMEDVTQAIATYVGNTIEIEPVDSLENDIPWAARVRIEGLPTDLLLWTEPLTERIGESVGIESGCILAVQTILHSGDPLTHFSNVMRILAGADLNIQNMCDLSTGRWFSENIMEQVFLHDEVEPPEEILWITRLVETPDGVEP